MTDLLAGRLAEVTVNHGSRTESELIDRAAALVVADNDGTDARTYAHRNGLRRSLASAVAFTGDETGAAWLDLVAAVEAHDRDLAELAISVAGAVPR